MSDEVEEDYIEKKIAAKRHNELTDKLDKVVIALSKKVELKKEEKREEKKDDGILNAITELSRNILSLPKPEKPNVNVEVNQDKLVLAIENQNKKLDEIFRCQKEILDELRILTQPKETIFDVKKNNYTGSLEKVIATTKFIKPKAQA